MIRVHGRNFVDIASLFAGLMIWVTWNLKRIHCKLLCGKWV